MRSFIFCFILWQIYFFKIFSSLLVLLGDAYCSDLITIISFLLEPFTFLISCPCFLLEISSPIFLFTNTFLSCLCSVIYPIKALYFNYHIFSNLYWRRQWHPTPVLLPGKSHGRRSLVGCSSWVREESDTTERLHFHFSLFMHRRRKWQPSPVFLSGESQGRGSLVGCCLWGRTELDTTEAT